MKLRLSPPKVIVWIIAVVAGVVGLLMHFGVVALGGVSAMFLVGLGFVLLALGTLLKGM
ncbi:MAG: hypothetical protein HYZ26_03675 [Chloroflexi bacterium]|nr:hypothetical protein [Chloroflexota bacterium]